MTYPLINMERVERGEKDAGRALLLELASNLREDPSAANRHFAADLLERVAAASVKDLPRVLFLRYKGRPKASTIDEMKLAAEVMIDVRKARQADPSAPETQILESTLKRLRKRREYKSLSGSKLKAVWLRHRSQSPDGNFII